MEMQKIIDSLEEIGFIADSMVTNNKMELENIHFTKGEVLVSIVAKNEENDNKILIKADYKKSFNGWSNSNFKWSIDNIEDFYHEVIFTLIGLHYAHVMKYSSYERIIKDTKVV